MKYIKKFNKSRKRFNKFVEFKDFCVFENKLYNKSTIISTTNRIGDDSDDILNKLAISGLYRTKFGDVQQIKSKKQLDSLFDEWYNETINGLVKTPEFIDNKELSKKYLDAYVNNIRSLGDNAQPFSLKKIETGLIDLVNNNNWINDDNLKQSFDIYNPKKEDVLYEDKNIVILNTNTKSKCVMYGVGEPWCITKPELNHYNTYRIKFGATPYFVLQKNEKHPVHKLVIMNYGNGYAIADQTNTGNRAGGKQSCLPWEQIEKEIPNLKGLEKYFMYKEVNDDEKRYGEMISKSVNYKGINYEGDDLQGFIDNSIKGLVVNGSQVSAVDFIRDTISVNMSISENQIKSLRTEVCDSLIESGYFLQFNSYSKTHLLTPKQRSRVTTLRLKYNKKLHGSEFSILSKNDRDKYLSYASGDDMSYTLFTSLDPFETQKLLGNKINKVSSILDMSLSHFGRYLSMSPNPDILFDFLFQKYPDVFKKIKMKDFTSREMEHLIIGGLSKNKLMEIYGQNFDKMVSDFPTKLAVHLTWNKYMKKEFFIEVFLEKKEFLDKLDEEDISKLLERVFMVEDFIKLPVDISKNIISKLNSGHVYMLLKNYPIEDFIKLPVDISKNIISKLNSGHVYMLLKNYPIEDFIKLPVDISKNIISKLNTTDWIKLILTKESPQKTLNFLLERDPDFLSKLDIKDIEKLIIPSKKQKEIIETLFKFDKFLSILSLDIIAFLLQNYPDSGFIVNLLGNNAEKYLSNLDSKSIKSLLDNSFDSEGIEEILKRFGNEF